MDESFKIFSFLVFIFSIIVHEVAHGLAAEREGDSTARLLGRITLNPLKHIDPIGSVLLPALLYFSGSGIIFGWAKPVPYDERNLQRGNKSVALVSIAGIVVNLGIAVFFGLCLRVLIGASAISIPMAFILSNIVSINIILALFNAIPLAPLDGFRFLSAVLPRRAQPIMRTIEQYSIPFLIAFIFFGWKIIVPLRDTLYSLLTGIGIQG